MNYSSLLLKIETHLLSLNKKGLKYINIGALPDFELKSVIDGLEEIISTEKHTTTNKTSGKPEKFQENSKENPGIGIPEPSETTDPTKIHNLVLYLCKPATI